MAVRDFSILINLIKVSVQASWPTSPANYRKQEGSWLPKWTLPARFPSLPWGPVLTCLLPLSLYPSWITSSTLPGQCLFPSLPFSFPVWATILFNGSHLVLGPLWPEHIPTVSLFQPRMPSLSLRHTLCSYPFYDFARLFSQLRMSFSFLSTFHPSFLRLHIKVRTSMPS